MRYNLMLAAALISGFAFCTFFPNSELAVVFEKSEYLLYALIFAVGITIGVDKDFRDIHNVFQWRLFILPLSILSGSVAASGVVIILLTGLDPFMVLAINAGVGYYSITSIIVGNFSDGLVAAHSPDCQRLQGNTDDFAGSFAPALVWTFVSCCRWGRHRHGYDPANHFALQWQRLHFSGRFLGNDSDNYCTFYCDLFCRIGGLSAW
jgi:hypothetical protein